MLLLLEAMNFVIYIYAKSHWKYHTFEGYYICSFSELRHKIHQQVRKCSLTFHLNNGIVTFYANCTNKYGWVDNLRLGWWYPPFGHLGYLRYNFLMAWAIITIYTSKCAHMDPQQLQKRQNLITDAKSVICKKP